MNFALRHIAAAFLILWAAPALTAPWDELRDVHLDVVPRSAAETRRIDAARGLTDSFATPEEFEALSAGAATVARRGDTRAFSQAAANLAQDLRLDFELGRALFEKLWVGSPSSTRASDGLGPLYNARGCGSCHVSDGRGFASGDGLVLRLSVPLEGFEAVVAGNHSTGPEPIYGGQLQTKALSGMVAEAGLELRYEDIHVAMSDGEAANLRKPIYQLGEPKFGPLAEAVMISPRVAPPMIGLGLLEAIAAQDILARADPEDADGDGISGRANVVVSAEFGVPMLGRFGWKASMPTVQEQASAAFSADLGLSTPLFPWHWGDCSVAQDSCRAAPHGGDAEREGLEVDSRAMALVVLYTRNLGVPERATPADPEVLRGKQVFYDAGCVGCHVPKQVTSRLSGNPAQSFQLIWPYTDLLLHDMGAGLADGRPDGRATEQEWRTAPLWGLGLVAQVGGQQGYLHDGRARDLLEAVLWHGGEAQGARDQVVQMPALDRAALIRFLESL